MTLAVILLNVSFALSPPLAAPARFQSSPPSQQTSQPTEATPAQDTSPTQSPPASVPPADSKPASSQASPAATPARKPAASPTAHHARKKPLRQPNCTPAPAAGNASSSADPAPAGKTATDPHAASAAAKPQTPPANCPPPKVTIVKRGGTSEPSIQLVGGADNSPAHDTSQYLQSAEENLKKLEGRQLSSNQRDMVTQIHQFMDQSKTATASGDVDSARTLAWKAQLLSEELVNPQK